MSANDNENGRSLRLFSWDQYNRAIRNILQDSGTDRMPLEVLIMLCLLFNQYDIFQCEYSAAYMHIKMGLKLVQDWSRRLEQRPSPSELSSATSSMIRDHVAPMLIRLDVQAALLMHSEAHSPAYDELTNTEPPTIPQDFITFSEARRAFDQTASYMFNVLGKRAEHANARGIARVRTIYEQWWLAFGSLVARHPVRLGTDDDRAIRLLRIYYNFARIVLDTHHNTDEMGYDGQTERFELMIQQAQDIVQFPAHKDRDLNTQPFSFDIALASPLNFIGARCRVPRIRRQAIHYLKTQERSSWNTEHCALIAQYLLETEEKGLGVVTECSQITSKHRIRRVLTEVCFDEEHIKLTYVHHPYSKDTPINVAILPLRQPHDVVTTAGAVELDQMPTFDYAATSKKQRSSR